MPAIKYKFEIGQKVVFDGSWNGTIQEIKIYKSERSGELVICYGIEFEGEDYRGEFQREANIASAGHIDAPAPRDYEGEAREIIRRWINQGWNCLYRSGGEGPWKKCYSAIQTDIEGIEEIHFMDVQAIPLLAASLRAGDKYE